MELEDIRKRLQEHLAVLGEKFEVESMGIFGSYVRREQRSDSDLDVLVTFKKPIDFFRFIELEDTLSGLLGVQVDLVTKNALKPRLGRRILAEVVPV